VPARDDAPLLPTTRPFSEVIVRYYEQTWFDYRVVWLNKNNLALHYGYTDEHARSHGATLTNMNRAVAERAQIRHGERVLDAGCGIGGSSMWLAQERGAEVVGITLVSQQVEVAREHAARRGLTDRARFEVADYTRTSFPDDSFDVVWALESTCCVASKIEFYREAARVLRPGGRVVIADGFRKARPLDPTAEGLLQEWLPLWAVADIDTREEHLDNLAATGFTDVRIEDITANVLPSIRRLHRMAFWTYPIAVLSRLTGLRSQVQHGNVIGALRQYDALRHGAWYYGILTATLAPTSDRAVPATSG